MAQGSWIGQPMNNNFVTPYPPLHLNMAVKQKQINLKMHSLSEDEKKKILKIPKLVQEQAKHKRN